MPLVATVSCSLICPSTPLTWVSSARACASLAASLSLFLGSPVTVPSLLLASTFTCRNACLNTTDLPTHGTATMFLLSLPPRTKDGPKSSNNELLQQHAKGKMHGCVCEQYICRERTKTATLLMWGACPCLSWVDAKLRSGLSGGQLPAQCPAVD